MSTECRKKNAIEVNTASNFNLVEIDLASGKLTHVDSHKIVAKDSSKTGYMTVSIGLSRRHGLKISPSTDK